MATSPNTDNYTLGKGVVYFDKLEGATYMGERDLGNAPEFSFNIALEKLEHFSSRGGLKSKDKEIISQITPGITFTLDELSKENLAMLTLADIVEITQTTASVTNESHIARLDKRVSLAYRDISAVTVTDAGAATTFVQGQDYEIDTELKDDAIGRILILASGSITEALPLEISYTYGTLTYTQIQAFNNTVIEGRLRFVSDNPVGTQQELEIWRVSLTPSGDTAMIGDDWSTLGFTGEILKDSNGHPSSPYMNFTIVD